MPSTDTDSQALKNLKSHQLIKDVRERALACCKDFKICWVQLGQALYAIEEDKLYHAWGFEKFEDYTTEELGFDKNMAGKIIKSYLYILDDEPQYLKENFAEERETSKVPSLDEINVLRLAKGKKELLNQDFAKLKRDVFEKGKIASAVRKDLTALIKERKPEDPEKEREKRTQSMIQSLIRSLETFQNDNEALKMVPHELVEEAEDLLNKLKEQVSRRQ